MVSLKINNLTVRYPFQQNDVLKGVNMDIRKGERLLILGPSGGGKSTLALAMNGIIPHSIEAELQGLVLIDGTSPDKLSYSEIGQKVGILFQDPETQFCMLTVEDEILFGLENLKLSKKEMEFRLKKSLETVGLTPWRKSALKELSGGMKQKLGIACLLAMDQEILILDEPTANLDPASTEEIFKLLTRLSDQLNKTLIFIEHKLDELLPCLDRVIVLDKEGRILVDDKPRAVFQDHFHTINKQGIWVPQICKAAKELESEGMIWGTLPLTLEDFEAGFIHQGVRPLNIEKRPACEVAEEAKEAKNADSSKTIAPPLLEAKEVCFSYQKHTVLECVSFSIENGDFVALAGPNGAGKSTLSKLIIKLLTPQKGNLYFEGKPLNKITVNELMQNVGYVFQNPEHQFLCDTVEEELAYGLKKLGWSEEEWKHRVDTLLQIFGLRKQRNNNPFSLSQGQKRRLSVATMLTNDQKLLILDEPTFGQDWVNTESLMMLLKDLNRNGKTIVMITHDMELIARYAGRVLLLHEGNIAYQGDVRSFFDQRNLIEDMSIKTPLSYKIEHWIKEYREWKSVAGAISEK